MAFVSLREDLHLPGLSCVLNMKPLTCASTLKTYQAGLPDAGQSNSHGHN